MENQAVNGSLHQDWCTQGEGWGNNVFLRHLGVFSIYIDDSGSAPEHKFAIAAGVVFPAKRIATFEREWARFLEKENISELHASECVAQNPHSAFAKWDDPRVERVLLRAQQIIFKYSVKGFSIGIHKQDYDEAVPKEMLLSVGSHYVWALSSVLGLSYDWASERSAPMEYVFDNTAKQEKRDIQEALDYSETIYANHFSGHYAFRRRREIAGLQAADLFAWACYQAGRYSRFRTPMKAIAQRLWNSFCAEREGTWATIQSLNREGLEMWVGKTHGSHEDLRLREYKQKQREHRQTPRRPD